MKFYVAKNPTGRSYLRTSHTAPKVFPSFVLVADDWDDFNVVSQFDLFFYRTDKSVFHLQQVKIIDTHEREGVRKYYTKTYLPDEFEELPDNFCSLGQSDEYYRTVKEVFPEEKEYMEVFTGLRDVAMLPQLSEYFEGTPHWHSLVRMNEAERMLREARLLINGVDRKEYYKFTYDFTPPYASEPTDICFDFEEKEYFPRRIYGVIGKNGVGKTQMISSIPLMFSKRDRTVFHPSIPLFSKVIAISNSYYDHFTIPVSKPDFNYMYCGLSMLDKDGNKELMGADTIKDRIVDACHNIQEKGRIQDLMDTLTMVIPEKYLCDFLVYDKNRKRVFNPDAIRAAYDMLSSGESALLYIFCNIIDNIRYDTLLLFDEPENHMHPNAITELMSVIFNLLDRFQSYAIITTHSPLVIRELKSDSVLVMERDEDYCVVRKIGIETLGANLTTLVEDIFDNKEIQKYYKTAIDRMVDDGKGIDDVIAAVSTEGVSPGLNLILYITSKFNGGDNEKN